jgi:ATP-binding cassette subfamily B protein/subfamily B ATP-binding cassette protein MsbA
VKNWSRVLSYFRPELPRVVLALLMMGLSIAANLLKPWPVALIIDHIVAGRPAPGWVPEGLRNAAIPTLLGLAALAIFALHSAQGVFASWQNYLSIKAGLNGLARLRNELFAWMQRLSLAFYQRRNQGDLIYRATWDTYSIQTIFQHGLFKFLNSLATVLLMVVVMWRVNGSLTLITLAVFPPLLASMYLFGKAMNRRSLAAHQADSQVTSLVQQNLANLPLVQSYTRENEEARVFGAQVEESQRARVAQHGMEVTYWFVIAITFGIATAGLTWWGAREILAGRLTVGELVIFLSYLGQLYDPLNQLSHVGATVSDANAGTQRIFEMLDAKETVVDALEPKPFALSGEGGVPIEFAGVSFGYQPTAPVLREISFRIEAGETIGLVGPSGAGKTTLLNLIPRFYDVDQGAVRVAGIDLREIALKELRQRIAYVFQESYLLPGTISENIRYGCEHADLARIEEAARMANAHEFIARLPKQYETVVGEGAARLSVGEKQRISIARAFLKNAPILLLDEPTSALDVETEALVLESLSRLMQNRTTIMAAHRVSTLRTAKRIAVLENGHITEIGGTETLLRGGGYFARMMGRSSAPV